MAAERTDVFCLTKFLFYVVVVFYIKRPTAKVNSVCYSFYGDSVEETAESFIVQSIYQYKQERILFIRPKHSLKLLLLLAGDVEICPGPAPKCTMCRKPMKKNQSVRECSRCKEMYHIKCLQDILKNGTEKLYCNSCYKHDEGSTDDTGVENKVYVDLNRFLTSNGLKVFHQNVNGIYRKIDEIKIMFLETRNKIQIFGVTETHLSPSYNTCSVEIDGYDFIRKDRSNGKGGGVGCYIEKDLNWQRRTDLEKENIEAIWIELFVKNSSSILICIIYRPPDSSKYLSSTFEEKLDDVLMTTAVEEKETIILGDINCDFLKPSDHKSLKEIIKRYGFTQVLKLPTRVTKMTQTLIDVIMTTRNDRIQNNIVVGNSISDHDLTGMNRKMYCNRCSTRFHHWTPVIYINDE